MEIGLCKRDDVRRTKDDNGQKLVTKAHPQHIMFIKPRKTLGWMDQKETSES